MVIGRLDGSRNRCSCLFTLNGYCINTNLSNRPTALQNMQDIADGGTRGRGDNGNAGWERGQEILLKLIDRIAMLAKKQGYYVEGNVLRRA